MFCICIHFSNSLADYIAYRTENDRFGGVLEEHPPRLRKVEGSISGRVIQKTIKMVVMAAI